MATYSTTQDSSVGAASRLDVDISGYFRNTVLKSPWHILFTIILVGSALLIIRGAYNAAPVSLNFFLAPNGVVTPMGSLILTLTSGSLLTILLLALWLIGLIAVVVSATRHSWPGPTQWLKDSLYTGPFGALVTLIGIFLIVFAIRGLLSWAVFGALFSSNPEVVSLLRDVTPGAIWGVVGANTKLFAVGQFPSDHIWRVWVALAVVLGLGALSLFAWNFGSPLKKFRKVLVWLWLLSVPFNLWLLYGLPGMETVPTLRWGGFLLTVILSVVGIGVSFPIGLMLALGRRSQTPGVPYLWLYGVGLLFIYWGLGGFPSDEVTLNVPVLFRDPPIWVVTLSPVVYAGLQALLIVGVFWAIGYFMSGNIIKAFSVVYIEMIRGVPLITVLFMAQVLLPIFLPKELEIDNLLRVTVGIILFSAAYLAENVRGGLQAIPKGQYEAAMAVGLSSAQSMRMIIMPQALRLVIPAIVGQFISLFKDTSLVSIVGLFDLLKIAQVVVAQPDWLGLQRETYAFVAFVYWIFAFTMSRASQRLEKKLGVGKY
ncbi:MAG: amino acid ABC transporter permease [Anaerolineae bacterium]